VPVSGKAALYFGVVYFFWPLDLIPDFLIPVIGSMDDVVLLLVCLRYLFYKTPPEVLQQHLAEISAGTVEREF